MASAKQQEFRLWEPGFYDKIRNFIISENFQGAAQLTVGLLFVSLFVFINALRFPGSCVAVLLYIVVAVTAAPDNHVGTRIFIAGFMIGPMWLALITGGLVGTLAKLSNDPTVHLILLCTLGPLAIIPFAIVRVGTGNLYLWAMGMVAALYTGMPIISGFPFHTLSEFWMRSVLFLFVAATLAMFAGSVLSMLVLPSLASHAVEDDVTLALSKLGHHLSATASQLLSPQTHAATIQGNIKAGREQQVSNAVPVKQATSGIHFEDAYDNISVQEVYSGLMDWFEHMSRPPQGNTTERRRHMGKLWSAKGNAQQEGSNSSTKAKSTFYGLDTAGLAAAVAAAATDAADHDTSLNPAATSATQNHVSQVILTRSPSRAAPAPSIADVRQLLAHANRLLDAAAAEPQWLRGQARSFEKPLWAAFVTKTQLLASRMSALDLVYRDNMAITNDDTLMDASHSFAAGPAMEQLLLSVYASAATVLSLLAKQAADRTNKTQGCKRAASILQSPTWQSARQQLFQLVEATLVKYWASVHQAGPDKPIMLPSAHWVRRWMFFCIATVGVMDATEAVAKAAAAALAVPVRRSTLKLPNFAGKLVQQQQQLAEQQLTQHGKDVETGYMSSSAVAAAEAVVKEQCSSGDRSVTQQHQDTLKSADQATAAAGAVAEVQPVQVSAAAAIAGEKRSALQRLQHSIKRHTAWTLPWLPMSFNVIMYQHLEKTLTKDLPAMFSSKAAFYKQLKGRRFRAGLKYWFVLASVMVGVLVLVYQIPKTARYAPNFAYSAAAVGMSDRVESTVFKVFAWITSSVVGAAIGWALMAQPSMANNPYALAAVIGAVCLLVGSLSRTKNNQVKLLTLMTIATMVLCQYTPNCCGGGNDTDTGSSMVAIVRGASVTVAALFAVTVQNLVWPWYTSSWALEQLGLVYQESAVMLAEIMYGLYSETHMLLQLHHANTADADDNISNKCETSGVLHRLALIDAAVSRILQQQQETVAAAAAGDMPQPPTTAAGLTAASFALDDYAETLQLQQNVTQMLQQQQWQQHIEVPAAAAVGANGAAAAAKASNPVQIQLRLLKPLVQVKISLILDTTVWSTGLYATPPVVLRLLPAMFDVADALAALQQATSVKVEAVSGSWDWQLVHMAQVFGQLLQLVVAMAHATLAHLMQPTTETAALLLKKIQEVQGKRYDFFTRSRELRRLLHIAVATDEQLFAQHMSEQQQHLQGHMRYSAAVYATSKVLDKMTAVARCALEAGRVGQQNKSK